MSNEPMSRRSFLQNTAAMAAAALSGCDPKAPTATPNPNNPTASPQTVELDTTKRDQNIISVLESYQNLTSQSGAFDPQSLKGKVTLFATGYNGCPVCARITETLCAAQNKLKEANIDYQLVVMSVNPDKDRKVMEDFITRYKDAGIDTSKLTLLMAASNEQAREIHTNHFGMRLENKVSHTPKLFMFDDKGQRLGAIIANDPEKKGAAANTVLNAISNGRQLSH